MTSTHACLFYAFIASTVTAASYLYIALDAHAGRPIERCYCGALCSYVYTYTSSYDRTRTRESGLDSHIYRFDIMINEQGTGACGEKEKFSRRTQLREAE